MVGRAGQCGLLVAALAEAEVAREDEHAPHPHPPMVGQTVWEGVRKERPAKCKTAVSKNQPITSHKLPVSFELIWVSFVCPLFRRYGNSSSRRAVIVQTKQMSFLGKRFFATLSSNIAKDKPSRL